MIKVFINDLWAGVIAQAPARAPDVVTSTHRRSNPNVDLPDLQQVAPSDDGD